MNPDMPALETARLLIRPFAADDLQDIHAILNEAFGEVPYDERAFWLDWVVRNYRALAHMYQPPYGDRAIVLKQSGRLIGSVGLVPSYGPFDKLPHFAAQGRPSGLNTPELGLFWALGAAHRGQGYATEAGQALIDYAFTQMDARRVVATTEYDNHGSIAVMQRLGMLVQHNPDPEPVWFQVVGILEHPALR